MADLQALAICRNPSSLAPIGTSLEVLVEARKEAGLTQAEVGRRIGKDQSYISIIEGSQRRVDVLEFCALSRALGRDPVELFGDFVRKLPSEFDI